MDDYTKRIEDLIHEIKHLRSTSAKLTHDLHQANKEILSYRTQIQDLKTTNYTFQLENIKHTQKINVLNKTILTNEKKYNNKIRRYDFYDNRRTTRNKLEKVLRIENVDLKKKVGIMEKCLELFGRFFEFDGLMLGEIMDYVESVDDECLKRLINNIIERNSKKDVDHEKENRNI